MTRCKYCGEKIVSAIEAQLHTCNAILTSENPIVTISDGNPISPETKASKHDQAKPDLSLIPYISNVEHAKAFMVGERKYGRYNYCKGHKASQLVAAIGRHSQAWFNGEETDPVDGQHHLGSVMACCSMLLRQMELGTMIDDRFKGGTNEGDKK